jgi:hypothetical protein
LGEANAIREDLYTLVLIANFKQNILSIHKKEAENNLKALNDVIAERVKGDPIAYPPARSS